MDVKLARQYHKTLSELLAELQLKQTVLERQPTVLRMQNMLPPMYVVNSNAVQHMFEALRKLKYPDAAVVNAALLTIEAGLQQLFESIEQHHEPHFVVYGNERIFAKPAAHPELRSLAEKERLFDHLHSSYVQALDAPQDVIDVLLSAEADTLKRLFQKLGFPHTDNLLFFKTKAQPSIGYPSDLVPSLKIVRLRSGVPVQVIKHRIL